MNPDEVVVHIVDRDRGNMIFDLLGKPVRQSGESANLHPHGQILAFDIARADVLRIGATDQRFLLAADAFGRTIAHTRAAFVHGAAVDFNQRRIVDFIVKVLCNCVEVVAQAISSQLNAIREAGFQILHEESGGVGVSAPYHPSANQLSIGVHGNPRPNVASMGIPRGQLRRDVLLFGSDEAPNLVTLDAFAGQVNQLLLHVV